MEENRDRINDATMASAPIEGSYEIIVCTDPLCCWSYAFGPELSKIKNGIPGAGFRLRMGGLLPGWKNFYDEVNSVTRPVQMGPVWMHAGQMANLPIKHTLWMTDPPASSYPACIAVKAAGLQKKEFDFALLELLRQTCMGEGKNIAKQDVINEAAKKLAEMEPEFDVKRFEHDQQNDTALNEFRKDLEFVKMYNINRFPSLIIKAEGKRSILVSGYRKAEEVLRTIENMS